jgi:hypothetical protein
MPTSVIYEQPVEFLPISVAGVAIDDAAKVGCSAGARSNPEQVAWARRDSGFPGFSRSGFRGKFGGAMKPSFAHLFRLRHPRWPALLLLSASLVASNSNAASSKYSIAYAIEKGGNSERGAFQCELRKVCRQLIGPEKLRLTITFMEESDVWVSLSGRAGCCYFDDANWRAQVDSRRRSHRLPIFEGVARRGNEFVQNDRVGILRLEFERSPD